MRILWIKTELLHPVDKGGRIRTYQLLRSLAREHHVTYLTLDDGQTAPNAAELAREYAHDIIVVPHAPPRKESPGYFVALLVNLLERFPYAVARYRSPVLRDKIVSCAAAADLVVCDFLAPSINVPQELGAKAVLFQHNVEAMIWKRHADLPQNPIRRAYMHLQWNRMRRFEAEECRNYSHVVAVSKVDADLMRDDYGVRSISHVDTGVDSEYFRPRSPRPVNSKEIVFIGSMDWMPNDDGIVWFCEDVLAKVQESLPAAKLTVVGRSPSTRLRQLAGRNPTIEVTGSVPDVRPYLERAAISIVPLRVGGGTRLKIYEAMAMALPVVSTTIGAEGLPVTDGEHLVIADSPAAQAAAIVALLTDELRATAMGYSAQAYVRAHCDWDAVARQFIEQCARRAAH